MKKTFIYYQHCPFDTDMKNSDGIYMVWLYNDAFHDHFSLSIKNNIHLVFFKILSPLKAQVSYGKTQIIHHPLDLKTSLLVMSLVLTGAPEVFVTCATIILIDPPPLSLVGLTPDFSLMCSFQFYPSCFYWTPSLAFLALLQSPCGSLYLPTSRPVQQENLRGKGYHQWEAG